MHILGTVYYKKQFPFYLNNKPKNKHWEGKRLTAELLGNKNSCTKKLIFYYYFFKLSSVFLCESRQAFCGVIYICLSDPQPLCFTV